MSSANPSSPQAAVDGILTQWNKAFVARDLEAMSALFASDGVYLLPGVPALVGADAISRGLKSMAESLPPGGLRIDFKTFDVTSTGADHVTFWASGDHQCQQDGQWTTLWAANALWVLRQTAPAQWHIAYLAVVPQAQEFQGALKDVHDKLTHLETH